MNPRNAVVMVMCLIVLLSAAMPAMGQAEAPPESYGEDYATRGEDGVAFLDAPGDPGQPMPRMSGTAGALLCPLIAFVLIATPYAILVGFIARRKGRSVPLWVIVALIPGVSIAVFWLVSQPDKQVLDRLAALEARLAANP